MKNFNLDAILEAMLKMSDRVSDLNFSVGRQPQVEVDGQLAPVNFPGLPRLTPYQTEMIAMHMLRGEREATRTLLQSGSVDISYSIPGKTRFRVNIFAQRGTYAIVLRVIPDGIPTLEQLKMPKELYNVPKLKNGIVLVTGPTGSGKSTTLAAIINQINQDYAYHILTIEDPVEYMHRHVKSTVNQREVGSDTKTFALALRAALRQAPKVILIGEMRDVETFSICLQAAETGHLVFSTVHTPSAYETMDRIINMFPPHEKQQICMRMANSLRGIVSQKLIPRADGSGRVAGVEVLIATPTVAKLVEEGRFGMIYDHIRDGEYWGMQTMNQCLLRYYRAGLIAEEDALNAAGNGTELRQMIRRPT